MPKLKEIFLRNCCIDRDDLSHSLPNTKNVEVINMGKCCFVDNALRDYISQIAETFQNLGSYYPIRLVLDRYRVYIARSSYSGPCYEMMHRSSNNSNRSLAVCYFVKMVFLTMLLSFRFSVAQPSKNTSTSRLMTLRQNNKSFIFRLIFLIGGIS